MPAVAAKPRRRRKTQGTAGFKRVVVATDFGLAGDRAVRRVVGLPLAIGAEVLIVHVLPDGIPLSAASVAIGAAEQRLDSARKKAAGMLDRRGRQDIGLAIRLARGDAAPEIARMAGRFKADLIVVGRGGARPLSGTRLGSTAQRVVRSANVPVLLVRLAANAPYRRVVLGFERSTDSLRAARLARQIAPLTGKAILVLHALQVPRDQLASALSKATARARWQAYLPVVAEEEGRIREALALVDPDHNWRLSCEPGDPRRHLLEAVRTEEAELLVVGTRSRKGLPRLLLGSVAEAVLNRADCDVLISPRQRSSR